MKLKFYKQNVLILSLALLLASSNLKAQNQGLYADTIKWPNSNAITVNLRASGFSNVINFQGTIRWDKSSLQFVSIAGSSILGYVSTAQPGNYSFGSTPTAVAQGYIAYIYSDAVTNHTVPNGTIVMSINFNVINNPLSTYSDNIISFSNNPTTIGIDTAADVAGLSDLATLSSPNGERHISGYVSFTRPPVLSYAAGNVTDSVSNRPVGCTYQWTVDGNNATGTSISTFNNAPTGSVCLSVTYPNNTTVSCTSPVLPVKLTSFSGKIVENKVLLTWATLNEINNKGFAIEKSTDGNTFNQISFVNADNSTTSQHQYSYADVYSNKTVWYRLKQVDNNGKFSYSNAVRIASSTKDLISVYPNPTKNFVKIEGNKIANVSITNTLGKVVLQKDFDGVSSTTLNIATLAQGVYVVSVKTATTTTVSKLIVE